MSEPPTPAPRPAAVAVVVRPVGACGAELLFVRRAVYPGDPWSGHIALPGGRSEPQDGSPEETARRETHEETGIDLTGSACVARLGSVTPRSVRLPSLVIHPFVFRYRGDPTVSVSAEIRDAFWLPLAELAAAHAWRPLPVTAGGATRLVRGYAYGDAVIWGITERVLADFLARADLLRQVVEGA